MLECDGLPHNIIWDVIESFGIKVRIKKYGTGNRKWLMLECDALPHNIIWDVIENVFWCWKCFNCYCSFETFKDHKCFGLNKVIEPHEFGWVLPVIGLLHLKMNAAWAFTKLNWDIFTSSLRATLGFIFLKAQVYIQKGSDHHKLWHFLEICPLASLCN